MQSRSYTYLLLYITCCFFLFGGVLTSCSSSDELSEDYLDDPQLVNLAIHARSTRGSTDKEGRVNEVRFLAFDRISGKVAYNDLLKFSGSTTPGIDNPVESEVIQLLEGDYDFIFIANEESPLTPENIKNKLPQVNNINEFKEEPYTHATLAEGYEYDCKYPFPMAAFYPNVNIRRNKTTETKQKFSVRLLMAVAKVHVTFKNKDDRDPTPMRVKSVKLSQIANLYSNPALNLSFAEVYGADFDYGSFKDVTRKNADGSNLWEENTGTIGSCTFYVPEYLIKKDDSKLDFVPTLVIEGDGFNTFILPLKPDDSTLGYEDSADMARVFSYKNFSYRSIVRNYQYSVTLNLTSSNTCESEIVVEDWSKNQSTKEFSDAEWEYFKIKIKHKNSTEFIDHNMNEKEIRLNYGDRAYIYFKLTKPEGGIWRASLTNNVDFQFDDKKIIQDIAGNERVFYVTPSHPFVGKVKSTEMYFSVGGEELPLLNSSDETSGIGNRYIFKQIEK